MYYNGQTFCKGMKADKIILFLIINDNRSTGIGIISILKYTKNNN